MVSNNTNKMDVETLLTRLKEMDPYGSVEIVWNGGTNKCRRFLTLPQEMAVVNEIVEGCLSVDDNSYRAEVYDLVLRAALVEAYTDIILPDAMDDKHILLYCSNAVSLVEEVSEANSWSEGQLNRIKVSSQKMLQDKLASGLEKAKRESEEIHDYLVKLGDSVTEMFGNIDVDGVADMLKIMSSGGVDEKSLVEEYVKQVMGSPERETGSAARLI